MEKNTVPAMILVLAVSSGWVYAELIAHYKFDQQDNGMTPDHTGTNYATLGDRVTINNTADLAKVGDGVLEAFGGGDISGPSNGAVTSNSFSWVDDARTVTFWWRSRVPNENTSNGAFVSFGTNGADGARMDIKESGDNATLRSEVQGYGYNTTPDIDDGNWHFIAVIVPDNAMFRDIAWYVDGSCNDLNKSTDTMDIQTGTGPLAFGDSILTSGDNDRVPNGYIDDFQLYNEALTVEQVQSLYNDPGSVIDQQLPDVDGGDDWITWSGESVTVDAAVNNNSEEPVLPFTYNWTVDQASLANTNLEITLTNADQEDPTVQVFKINPTGDVSTVTLILSVNNQGNAQPDISDSITVEVYDNACLAGLAYNNITTDPADLNSDCVTNIEDLAIMLTEWMFDYSLIEPYLQ